MKWSTPTTYNPQPIPKNPTKELIAAFDFETHGLGGELLMAQWCVLDDDGVIRDTGYFNEGTPEKIMNDLWLVMKHYQTHQWVAHNANYDWRYLLPHLDDMGYSLDIQMATDTKIMKVECQGVTMRDTYLLYPVSLKKFTQQFAPDLAKLEIDIENFNPKDEKHIEYAVRDVEGLATATYNYRGEFVRVWGVNPQWTMASSAMKAWRTTIKEPVQPGPRKYENFFRHAYSGGFVAPLYTGIVENAVTYDINSSYPAAMRKGVPGGPPMIAGPEHYDVEEPGFWVIDVVTPEGLLVPVLPYRGEKIHKDFISLANWELPKKLSIYPKGSFRTIASSIEINFARSVGYEITPVYGLVFEKIIYPFNNFVDTCEQLRIKYTGQPTEIVVKGTQNSLYGKFGMMRIRREVIPCPQDEDEMFGWTPLESLGDRYGYVIVENEDMLTAPHVAAWITAQARVRLFESIYSGGAEHVLYCDTDSITVTPLFDQSKIDISKKYGDFKLEKTWDIFRAHAPKVYSGKVMGEWKGACKGIPKPDGEIYERIFNGEKVTKNYKSLSSVMKFLTDNEKREAVDAIRTSTDYRNCAGWKINPGKRTDLREVK